MWNSTNGKRGGDPGAGETKTIVYPSFSDVLNLSKTSFDRLKGMSPRRAARIMSPNLLTVIG